MSINHPAELDASLLVTLFQTDLQQESLPDDIYDRLSGQAIYESGKKTANLPESMYMKLDAAADEARTVRVPMTKEFSGDPTLGSAGDQRLNEEDHEVKYFDMEYTDVSHASSNQAFGVLARDKIPYKLFESRVPKMGRYFKQYFGKMRRQATYECQSENLLEAPHFNAARLHPHWFIPNLEDADQPDYDTDYATYVDNVGTALALAGTGTDACVSTVYLQRLEEWAFTNLFIEPDDLPDGGQGYTVVLPSPQCRFLKHPVNAQTLGPIWRDVSQFTNEEKAKYPGVIGQFQRLIICEDTRHPTLTLGGSGSQQGGDYSITIQYRGMGRADDGSSDPRDKSASARQLGALYGKKALCEWMPEKFHWEWEYEMYDKFFGSGVFCSVGIKLVEYDITTGADETTLQHDGSIVMAFAAPPISNT